MDIALNDIVVKGKQYFKPEEVWTENTMLHNFIVIGMPFIFIEKLTYINKLFVLLWISKENYHKPYT